VNKEFSLEYIQIACKNKPKATKTISEIPSSPSREEEKKKYQTLNRIAAKISFVVQHL